VVKSVKSGNKKYLSIIFNALIRKEVSLIKYILQIQLGILVNANVKESYLPKVE